MKIAVTGGAGFIGRRLVESLKKEGHECVIIDTAHENPVDLMNSEALTEATKGCEAIYHLAALHRDDIFPRSLYYDVNRKGTQNVIAAAETHGIKQIIFTSTFAVYGLNTGMPDEDSTPQPFNDYGQSKLEAEQDLKKWAERSSDHICTIVRPVVVFGEGNRGNVYTLLNQITSGKFVMIGSGDNKKSMAYVGNVAGFLQHCLNQKPGFAIYNYADKPDFTMNALTDVIYTKLGWNKPKLSLPYAAGLGAGYVFDGIARLTGKQLPISSIRVKKFCANTTCAADKYKKTGFQPQFTLQEGVERMIENDFSQFIHHKKAA